MEKIKISMVKYDKRGKPVDVAYGDYKSEDVKMFRDKGYIDVDEDLAKQIDKELSKEQTMPWNG